MIANEVETDENATGLTIRLSLARSHEDIMYLCNSLISIALTVAGYTLLILTYRSAFLFDLYIDIELLALVLREKEECTGLVRLQEFTEKSGGAWSLGATAGKYEQKTIKKLQKKAASLGGCAILITLQDSRGSSIFRNLQSCSWSAF